jgi:hypothetical protein
VNKDERKLLKKKARILDRLLLAIHHNNARITSEYRRINPERTEFILSWDSPIDPIAHHHIGSCRNDTILDDLDEALFEIEEEREKHGSIKTT